MPQVLMMPTPATAAKYEPEQLSLFDRGVSELQAAPRRDVRKAAGGAGMHATGAGPGAARCVCSDRGGEAAAPPPAGGWSAESAALPAGGAESEWSGEPIP